MQRARPFLAAVLAAAAGLGAAAVPAAAELVYVKESDAGSTSVHVAADDGTGERKLASDATSPRISADATFVAYLDQARRELWLTGTHGGRDRRLHRASGLGTPRFSPDGALVGVATEDRLLVFETETARMGVVARGDIDSFSFSPDGQQMIFQRTRRGETDLFIVSVLGGKAKRLTKDGRSLLPVWGAQRIAFVKRKLRSGDYDIWSMTSGGDRLRRVTKTKVPDGASGLVPVAYSADGRRLIAQYIAGDGSVQVGFTVNPYKGRTRALRRKVAFAISRDGTAVLTQSGGPDEGGRHNIYSAPYEGGRSTLLVRDAFLPDWSR